MSIACMITDIPLVSGRLEDTRLPIIIREADAFTPLTTLGRWYILVLANVGSNDFKQSRSATNSATTSISEFKHSSKGDLILIPPKATGIIIRDSSRRLSSDSRKFAKYVATVNRMSIYAANGLHPDDTADATCPSKDETLILRGDNPLEFFRIPTDEISFIHIGRRCPL
jgi:hypothetical protein